MSEFTILIDDREKQPWTFDDYDVNIVTERLDTGDYSVLGFRNQFAIERKSLEDLANCSYGDQHERFRKEVIRAQEMKNFTVIIESPAWHLYDYVGTDNSPYYYSNVHPNSVKGLIDSWSDIYDINGFAWAQNTANAALQCYTLLKTWVDNYA